MLKLEIEVCQNCQSHKWYTKHDSKRYEDTFTKITAALAKYFPGITIEKNNIPTRLLPVISKHLSDDTYYDPLTDEIKTIPRVGAFEVTLFGRTIFSKLKTGLWPNMPSLIELIKEMVNARNEGEDLDVVFQRFTKQVQKTNNSADPLNRSHNIRSQSRGRTFESDSKRTKIALLKTQLDPMASRSKSPNLFNIRKLNKTDSNKSEVKYSRAKTPEVQRPPIERSRSPAGRPSIKSTLYIRDKIRRESEVGSNEKPLENEANSRPESKNFRSHRYNFSKSKKISQSEQSEQSDSSFLQSHGTNPPSPTEYSISHSYLTEGHDNSMNQREIATQEMNYLTSLALQSYENQLLISKEQVKPFRGVSDDKKIKSIQQSNSSTQDPEDRAQKTESLSNETGLLIDTEELVSKYHSISANNSLSSNFQTETSNANPNDGQPKLILITSSTEAMGNQGSLQYLENRDSLGPINSLAGQDHMNFLEVPETFRVQENKVSPKFGQMHETPKNTERKDFSGLNELQKTAQFCKPTFPNKEMPIKDKIFPRRVPSRGSNRYQSNEDLDAIEPGSNQHQQQSKRISAGSLIPDSGQLTFRNTSSNQTVTGSNQVSTNISKQRESNDSVRIKADSTSIDFEETGDFNQIKYPDPRPDLNLKAPSSQFRKKKYNSNDKTE